jgi:adenine phosphoribosyltransferase
MFSDVEITEACARELLKIAPEFDIIITAESKGIPLAYEMARQAGMNDYIVARKGPKLYMKNVVTTEVNSITTDHIQTLCLGQDEIDKMKDKRVLIVDDVISTGESLKSLEVLVKQVGGNIVGSMAVMAEGEAADRDDILFLEKLPLFNADGSVK